MAKQSRLPILSVGAAVLSTGCVVQPAALYAEPYRPQLSYSPQRNWMNDPNGLVYYAGEYHLFYQYNPNGNSWGDMSWGHAVSTDLLHWTELPVALPVEQDAAGAITQMFFSGSAVIDHANTSGLGQPGNPAMVALYTAVYPQAQARSGSSIRAGTQAQSLAYSLDRGRTWSQYAGNPVIAQPPSQYAAEYRDFRDPKVFWYEPERKWVMVLVASNLHKALIYSSPDLIDWEWMSEFGPRGATGGIWECPDLFELAVDGDAGRRKWVLLMSLNPGGPAGGSGTQYFIGDFDGRTFTWDRDGAEGQIQWLDHGADFYAGVSFNEVPDGRRLLVGWMNNWDYAREVPTTPWRSAQSLPRQLSLQTIGGRVKLVQQPLAEAQQLRKRLLYSTSSATIGAGIQALVADLAPGPMELTVRIQPGSATRASLILGAAGQKGEFYTEVGYDRQSGQLYLDRTHAGQTPPHAGFAARHTAPVTLHDGELPLRIVIDTGSVTVFGGKGEVALTDQVFAPGGIRTVSLYGASGEARVRDLQLWSLRSIWGQD